MTEEKKYTEGMLRIAFWFGVIVGGAAWFVFTIGLGVLTAVGAV